MTRPTIVLFRALCDPPPYRIYPDDFAAIVIDVRRRRPRLIWALDVNGQKDAAFSKILGVSSDFTESLAVPGRPRSYWMVGLAATTFAS
jgi:hypothetical protein